MARWPAGVLVDRAQRLTYRRKWGLVPRPSGEWRGSVASGDGPWPPPPAVSAISRPADVPEADSDPFPSPTRGGRVSRRFGCLGAPRQNGDAVYRPS